MQGGNSKKNCYLNIRSAINLGICVNQMDRYYKDANWFVISRNIHRLAMLNNVIV